MSYYKDRFYAGLIDLSEDFIMGLSKENEVIFINQSAKLHFKTYLNASVKEGDYLSIPELLFEEQMNQLKSDTNTFRKRIVQRIQLPHAKRFYNLYLTPIYEDDEIIGSTIRLNDLTFLLQQHEIILQQEEKYFLLVNSIKDVIFEIDLDGKLVFLNKAWESEFFMQPEVSLGKTICTFIDENYKEDLRHQVQEIVTGSRANIQQDYQLTNGNNQKVWVHIKAYPKYDQQLHMRCITGIIRNINDEKTSNEIYRLLSNNVKDMVCVHDEESLMKYVSPSSISITGYLPAEMLGKSPLDFIEVKDKPDLLEQFKKIKDDPGLNIFFRYKAKNKQGIFHWYETVLSLFDGYQKDKMMVSSTRIIDEGVLAKEQMELTLKKERELNELKTQFIQLTSHEIRTPLASIRSSAEILSLLHKDLHLQDAELEGQVDKIIGQVDRLTSFSKEILLVNRLEAQNFSPKIERVNAVLLLQDILTNIYKRFPQFKKEWKINLAPANYFIDTDRIFFTHIIDNIASNALKYSVNATLPPELSIREKGKNIIISIKDYGIGIPEKDQATIFNLFQRGSNVDYVQGTGLGLYISEKFATLIQAKISFSSSAGKGTTFRVSIAKSLSSHAVV